MKVELNGLASVTGAVERSAKQISPGSTAPSEVTADRTTFQSGSASVQSLVKQALSTPDVRQDKVDALRSAISNGTYKVDVNKLASALIGDSSN